MKSLPVIFFVFVIALLLQPRISVFGIPPAFTVIVAYSFGINNGSTKGIMAGSLIGLLEDSVGGGMIGPNMLGKGITGFLASLLSGGVFRWTPLFGMLALFILTLLDGFTVFLSKTLSEAMPASPLFIILTILVQGLMNTLIGAFIRPKNAE